MRISTKRLELLLDEHRGDIRLNNEDLATRICEGLAAYTDDTTPIDGEFILVSKEQAHGETPVVVAKDLREARINSRLTDMFKIAHLHELWAEFLSAQTLQNRR